MFSKEDFLNYLEEAEELYRKNVEIYTDLLNVLEEKSLFNKLFMIANEDLTAFEYVQSAKTKLKGGVSKL